MANNFWDNYLINDMFGSIVMTIVLKLSHLFKCPFLKITYICIICYYVYIYKTQMCRV